MTLYEMLRAIVKDGSPFEHGSCNYCGVDRWRIDDGIDTHEPDCLWIQAIEYIDKQEAAS